MMANASVFKSGISVGSEVNDIDFNKKDEIQSEHALVKAATVGNLKKVWELLKSGVSVDAEEFNKLLFYSSKNYVTPLQIAAAKGHEKCVQILINHGADVNAKDRFDVTALHMAAEKGHYLCIKALLDAGADCCVPTKFSKSGCYTAVPHLGGTTPLHLAAANNHVNCVKELIQNGADYNAVNEFGHTSLYIAAHAGFEACVLAHLKNAVGKDILSLPSFETSDTPLHFAVSRHMVDCVKELLCLGSDVNHINHHGCSPLHLALVPSTDEKTAIKMEILKLLVLEGYNTDINHPDARGFKPLHYVCFNGVHNLWSRRPEMAKFLIAYGADVNIKNRNGCSLLECELKSSEKCSDILRYLVKSMLRLPHLKNLNLRSDQHRIELAHREYENALFNRDFDPDDPDEFVPPRRNQALGLNLFLGMNAPAFAPMQMRPLPPPPLFPLPPLQPMIQHVRYAARLPLLMDDDDDDDAWEGNIDERNVAENENDAERNLPLETPDMIKKQLWYEQIASNPRTLQHNCRYVIRNFMGASKLKCIRSLPIPASLQSYLLLEYDE